MALDWGIFKRHPYLTAGGAVVVFIIVYFAVKSSGSSGGATAASGGSASSSQDAALQASENIASLQTNAQLSAAQINAGVQTTAINAQQETTDTKTSAQLQAILAQTSAQEDIIKEQSAASVANTQALEGIVNEQYTSQVQEHSDTLNYLTTVANDQAYVAGQQIQTQGALSTAALSHVKDVGGSQNRTAIILAAEGNPQGSTAAAVGQTQSSISSDSMLGKIGSSIGSVIGALF